MVTVANCFDLVEANYLRMVLESAGIPVFIPDEMTASIAPHYFMGASGVRVQVADDHAAQAHQIITAERQGS